MPDAPAATSGRVPPQSNQAERGVLGSMLLEREAVALAVTILRPEDFYHDRHRVIYAAMVELFEDSQPIDLLTLGDRLAHNEKLEVAGGLPYLAGLSESVPTAAHVERYAKIVLDRATKRQVIRAGTDIVARGYEPDVAAEDLLNETDDLLRKMRSSFAGTEPDKLSDLLTERITHVYGQADKTPPPVRWNLPFDRVHEGFAPGELTIVAARTSMGKTFAALHVARQCAIHLGRPVLICTLEMTRFKVADRLFASLSGIPANRLRDPEVWERTPAQHTMYAVETLDRAPIRITQSHRTTAKIRAAASRMASGEGLGLVIIDYLELVEDDATGEKRDHLGKLAQRIRGMALDLEVPVLLVHQLNRAPDARPDKRPFLSDLRDSGHLENAADAVILLYRPGYYDATADPSEIEIICAKQRDAPEGMSRARLDRRTGVFSPWDEGQSEPPPDRRQPSRNRVREPGDDRVPF